MVKLKIISLIIMVGILFPACSDTIFLVEDEAYMPIEIVGNLNSDLLMVILHGGPGSGAIMYYQKDNNFKTIEDNYMVAYYDQRLAGISQGHTQPETLTLETLSNDLHKVIVLLRQLHHPKKIVICGHSFGGMLGIQYLSDFGKTDTIHGFIDIDGLHNTPLAYSSAIKKVRSYAKQQIDENIETKYWQEALNFYESIDTTRLLKYSKHYEYVIKSNGVHYQKPIQYVTFDNLFFSEASGFDNLFNSNNSLKIMGDDILRADFSDILPSITLPALIIWGKHDGVIPLSSAYDAFNKIGTSTSEKQLIILEESAHEPFIEQREEFGTAVVDFIKSTIE